MPRATLNNLHQVEAAAHNQWVQHSAHLMVCHCTTCLSAGAEPVREALEKEVEKQNLGDRVKVDITGATAFCAMGPAVVIQPQGVFYGRLKAKDAPELIESHFIQDRPLERKLFHTGEGNGAVVLEKDIPFVKKQQAIVLRNRSQIDPTEISDAVRRGAYRALQKVLADNLESEEIIRRVTRSGIRGRGGGGFPAGVKWQSALKAARERNAPVYVVCNADEGDPGAYMDRSIIEADPHAVIEGMCIGARALGAAKGFVYIRREYPLALRRLIRAVDQAREWGLLGESILGTDMNLDIVIHRGAGAFVCGESTALFASMEGRPGEPRAKYVHSVEYGYEDQPTVLNNVETWANIPQILFKGEKWFASIGTGDVSESPWGGSTGTKVFSLVGNVEHTGLVEVPMGITLREIVFDIGGGIPDGRSFKAVQTGGPSGGCLPESKLDLPVDFDTLQQAGSMMGSGGLIVMDDRTCMVDVAKYFVDFLMEESCGKCTPCREGLTALNEVLTRIAEGKGREEDLQTLFDLGEVLGDGALCGLGQTAANPVLTTLRYFRKEYDVHIQNRKCPAGVCKALIIYTIDAEKCTGCGACVKPCPTECITGEKKKLHVIDQSNCIQCGTCMDACKDDAVLVE